MLYSSLVLTITHTGTTEVGLYSFTFHDQQTVYMIDTPGFDDTSRSDSEILQEIALFLASLYVKKTRLVGLIYLHRITDPRISGSSLKNIRVFQKLCGERAFSSIIVATTMWGALDAIGGGEEIGRQRSDQLQRPEYWGEVLKKGGAMMAHDGSKGSAQAIISKLAEVKASAVLDIQVQMVDERRPLDETEAGLYLQNDFLEARKRYEQNLLEFQESMEQALAEKDEESVNSIRKEREEAESRMLKLQNDNAELKISLDQLAARVMARYLSKNFSFDNSPEMMGNQALEERMKSMQNQLQQMQNDLQLANQRQTTAAAAYKHIRILQKKIYKHLLNKGQKPQETKKKNKDGNLLALVGYLFSSDETGNEYSGGKRHQRSRRPSSK